VAYTTHVDTAFYWASVQVPERLSRPIAAFEAGTFPDGSDRSGRVSVLPEGAALETCGSGFNCRSLKVRCDGSLFFVFLRDLEEQAE
jgi:hypothetical protein